MKSKGPSLGYEIRTLSNLIGRVIDYKTDDIIDDCTMSGTCGWIIGYLCRNPGADVYQRDIEEKFAVRRSTVSRVVSLMESKGLLERSSVSHDARLKKLTLTPKAEAIYETAKTEIDKIDREMTEGLTREEIDMYIKLTRKIKENLGCKDMKVD